MFTLNNILQVFAFTVKVFLKTLVSHDKLMNVGLFL